MPKLTKMEWFVAGLTVVVLLLAFAWLISVSTHIAQAASEPAELEGELSISGSTALLSLMQAAAGEFTNQNPKVKIAVDGGGSSQGRSDVCGGKVDIGDSDAPLLEYELTGLNCQAAVQTLVAIQAFVYHARSLNKEIFP